MFASGNDPGNVPERLFLEFLIRQSLLTSLAEGCFGCDLMKHEIEVGLFKRD
jgi:hypothetical protein